MKLSDFSSIRLHFVVAVLALPTGCGTAGIVGERLRDDIAINGSAEEWRGRAQFHDRKKDLAIRVLNDENSVYLCFSTSDRELVKQLGTTGLTVWFDPKGAEKNSYGVRLPPGKRPRRFPFSKDGEAPVENRGLSGNGGFAPGFRKDRRRCTTGGGVDMESHAVSGEPGATHPASAPLHGRSLNRGLSYKPP